MVTKKLEVKEFNDRLKELIELNFIYLVGDNLSNCKEFYDPIEQVKITKA